MTRITGVLVGFILLALLIDSQNHQTKPVYMTHEHWHIKDHYVHSVKLEYPDLQKLTDAVIEFEPYIYESYIEIRFTTSEPDDFYSVYDKIENELYQITTQIKVR